MHPDVALTMRSLGADYLRLNMYAEAEPLLTRLLAIDKNLPAQEQSADVKDDMQELLLLYEKQRKYFQYEATYKRLLAILQEAVKAGKPEAARELWRQMSQYANYLLKNATRINKPPDTAGKPLVPGKDPDESRETTKLGNYVATYRLTGKGVSEFSLSKDGKQVLSRTRRPRCGVIHFVDPYEPDIADETPVARDINGDGIPELILLDVADDAHACATCVIFALSDHGPKLELNHEFNESRPSFKDLNHDGRLEIVAEDTNYIGWNCCVPGSPQPRVALAWNGKTWVASAKFMAAPQPSAKDLDKIVRELKKDLPENAEYINPDVWGKMLDLIYSGNAPAAHELLKRMWTGNAILDIYGAYRRPYSVRYRERFWTDLVEHVKESQYLPVLRELNPGIFDGRRSDGTAVGCLRAICSQALSGGWCVR